MAREKKERPEKVDTKVVHYRCGKPWSEHFKMPGWGFPLCDDEIETGPMLPEDRELIERYNDGSLSPESDRYNREHDDDEEPYDD